ncbi:unnamed protein product [Effrenium voratum]|uniref:Magnesium chelatase n=1 Tax=Effrenium voratum TaxID=2562239 RepID=A0AA36JSG3_9DINO|nr:unnamed protein product [Effrenium voratum]
MDDFARPFPFSAVVGQEEIKLAILLNLVDPSIGGVMISGDRGTGKSTCVRGMVRLLPDIEVVKGDPYNSHPTDVSLMSDEATLEKLYAYSVRAEAEGLAASLFYCFHLLKFCRC